MFRLSKPSLVLPFLILLLVTPAVRADQFTASGHIPGFTNSNGHYTYHTFGTGNPTGDYAGRGSFDLSSTGQISNGEQALLNGNGDIVVLSHEGTVDLNTGVIKETFKIIGGTGQFDGATGSGTITGQLNIDGSVNYSIDGTINLP